MSITLYDIWSTAPGRSISPNTFKARLVTVERVPLVPDRIDLLNKS